MTAQGLNQRGPLRRTYSGFTGETAVPISTNSAVGHTMTKSRSIAAVSSAVRYDTSVLRLNNAAPVVICRGLLLCYSQEVAWSRGHEEMRQKE